MGKRLILIAVCLIICFIICLSACAETKLFAVNAGKGDALLVMTDDGNFLIDTGKKKAREAVEEAFALFGIMKLDAVFITHTDSDHTGGLKWLRESDTAIGKIYASRFTADEDKRHPAERLAGKLDIDLERLGAGDTAVFGQTVFSVFAPEERSDNEDDCSLVMMLETGDGRILLTGDMEFGEEAFLLNSGRDLQCDILKVPNHGDHDACSPLLIGACAPSAAVISTSSEEKPGTPDAEILKNLELAGCEVFITQDSKTGVLLTLNSGIVSAELM